MAFLNDRHELWHSESNVERSSCSTKFICLNETESMAVTTCNKNRVISRLHSLSSQTMNLSQSKKIRFLLHKCLKSQIETSYLKAQRVTTNKRIIIT